MDLGILLLHPTILESLCLSLDFEEAIQLRQVLKLQVLNCRIPVVDKKCQKFYLNRVDDDTIQIYYFIKKYGINKAFYHLIDEDRDNLVKVFIDQDIDLPVPDKWGNTTLIIASSIGSIKTVKMLLQKATKDDINRQRNWDEATALHRAVLYGHLEIAKILLEHGADPTIKNDSGETPLTIAKYGGLRTDVDMTEIIQLMENLQVPK